MACLLKTVHSFYWALWWPYGPLSRRSVRTGAVGGRNRSWRQLYVSRWLQRLTWKSRSTELWMQESQHPVIFEHRMAMLSWLGMIPSTSRAHSRQVRFDYSVQTGWWPARTSFPAKNRELGLGNRSTREHANLLLHSAGGQWSILWTFTLLLLEDCETGNLHLSTEDLFMETMTNPSKAVIPPRQQTYEYRADIDLRSEVARSVYRKLSPSSRNVLQFEVSTPSGHPKSGKQSLCETQSLKSVRV